MFKRFLCLAICALTVALTLSEADARVGGSRSLGSRGSRSYSAPATSPTQSSPYQQAAPQQAPRPFSPPPYQAPQPAGGGFLRSMAGGIAGGLLGGMLFRSLGMAGAGGGWGGAGGGIGIFEIILIGGILYLIYRLIKNKRAASQAGQNVYSMDNYREPAQFQGTASSVSPVEDLAAGVAHIRQFDPAFDEQRFCDQVMDIFFKIQSAWMNRDLSPAGGLLTAEVRRIFQEDIDRLIRERRVNRLENIAVRNVEIVEAWQESGQDYLTALIYANLLDYTTDDAGQVLEGSKTEPIKFEEYWTFTRPLGNNQWQLSAINQK